MHRNIAGPKLQSTVSKKRKLKELVRKRAKVLFYLYFHIQALLGFKFGIQNLFHELQVLPMSLAHLVARMLDSCKRSDKNRPIPSKSHFLNFLNMSHGLRSCLKEQNIISYHIKPIRKSGSTKLGLYKMCRENGYQHQFGKIYVR